MSEYSITLITQDKKTVSFPCAENEDIVTAAVRAKTFLVAQCCAGHCGACFAQVEQGEFDLAGYFNQVLPEEARQQGQTLLCCTYPRSDMRLTLPYEHYLLRFAAPEQRSATITRKTFVTPDTVKLELQLQADAHGQLGLEFVPGQFVELWIPDTHIKRAYSLANAPNSTGALEFLIKLRPHGQFSTFLQNRADVGMSLTLTAPQGTFMLADRGLRPRYLVAGGCGLASIISMLRAMAEQQAPHEVRLFFGVWREDELFYQQELAEIAAGYSQFSYQLCVTDPSATWQGYRGSVVDAVASALQSASSQPDVYICGSPGLIEAVAQVAAAHGIARETLIYEHYGACATTSEEPVTGGVCEMNPM